MTTKFGKLHPLRLLVLANVCLAIFAVGLAAFYLFKEPSRPRRSHEEIAAKVAESPNVDAIREFAVSLDANIRTKEELLRYEAHIYRIMFPIIAIVCAFNSIALGIADRRKHAKSRVEPTSIPPVHP